MKAKILPFPSAFDPMLVLFNGFSESAGERDMEEPRALRPFLDRIQPKHPPPDTMKTIPILSLAVGLLSVASAPTSSASLPYVTDFSEERGFFAGAPPNAEGWIVRPESTVVATDHSVRAGQSVLLYHGRFPGAMKRGFTPNGNEVVFVDLFVRPVTGESIDEGTRIAFDTAEVAFLHEGSESTIAVSDISPDRQRQWVDIRWPIDTDSLRRAENWVRVTLRLDYGPGNDLGIYDIYIDGELAEHDLAFRPRRFVSGRSLTITGARSAESWVDDIYAGNENPLYSDVNRNGLPDDWLLSSGLSLDRAVRYEEPIGDDRTAIEAFLAETRPDYPSAKDRASVIELGRKLRERRLNVFTRLEKPDLDVEQLIRDLEE